MAQRRIAVGRLRLGHSAAVGSHLRGSLLSSREDSALFEPDGAQPIDLVAALRSCIEHGRRALLLDHGSLPAAFFDLSTGVAGELVQKLVNYHVRMAAVVPDLAVHSPRFREFAGEANRGRQFRFFATRQEAIDWLRAG